MATHAAATSVPRMIRLMFVMAATLGAPMAVAGSADPWDGDWHPAFTAYGWLPGVSSNLRFQAGDGDVQNKSDGNILDNLSGAFMLQGEIRKGDWGLFGDIDWVKFDNEKGHLSRIGGDNVGADVRLDTNWGVKGGMFTIAGLYTLGHGANGYTDLMFGLRYLWLTGNLDWNFGVTGTGGALDISNEGHLSRDGHVTAAIIGLKGRWMINQGPWFVPYYVDAGWGSSDFTAQAAAGIGYAFNWGDLGFTWRHVRYSKGDDSAFLRRLDIDGPSINLSWQF